MSIAIPLLFYILAIMLFLIVLFEDKDEKPTDEEQEKSDDMIIFLLIFATLFFFVGGACWMGVTNMYYSPATDTVLETLPNVAYRPIGWIGIVFGIFFAALATIKMFDRIDLHTEL